MGPSKSSRVTAAAADDDDAEAASGRSIKGRTDEGDDPGPGGGANVGTFADADAGPRDMRDDVMGGEPTGGDPTGGDPIIDPIIDPTGGEPKC